MFYLHRYRHLLFFLSILNPLEKAENLKDRILDLYPYSTYFGASYTVESLDALYGTPNGVVV